MTLIIGVDPGGTCGYAAIETDTGGAVIGGQLEPLHLVRWVWSIAMDSAIAMQVACERYTITMETARMSRQSDALEVIGALRYFCQLTSPQRIFNLYTPADAKRMHPDPRLKELSLHCPGRPHGNDAMRQCLIHLASTDPQTYATLLKGGYTPSKARDFDPRMN